MLYSNDLKLHKNELKSGQKEKVQGREVISRLSGMTQAVELSISIKVKTHNSQRMQEFVLKKKKVQCKQQFLCRKCCQTNLIGFLP